MLQAWLDLMCYYTGSKSGSLWGGGGLLVEVLFTDCFIFFRKEIRILLVKVLLVENLFLKNDNYHFVLFFLFFSLVFALCLESRDCSFPK